MGNHAVTGTPRGFNLSQMPFNVAGAGVQSGFNMQALFNPAMAGNWDALGGDGDRTGPMRRTGGRFTGNRSGPYDRQSRDNRNPRFGAAGGRLTPPPRGGRPGGGGRYDSGGPGPLQSTQGRSLKSYEDLDAVGNADTELNY